MIRSLRANPIITWFVRREAHPSVSLTLALTAGLWIAAEVIMQVAFKRHPAHMPLLNQFLLWLAFGATVSSLPIASTFAVILIVSDVRSGRRDLLQITNLSDEALVQGYIFAALHRLRVLLMLVVGLSPALTIGWVHRLIMLRISYFCSLGIRPCSSIPPEIGLLQSGVLLALSAMATTIIPGMIIMCASFGTWTAMRRQKVAQSVAAALAMAGLVLPPLVFILALLMKSIMDTALRWPDIFTLLSMILFTTVIGLAPYTLVEHALRSARQLV